jgi:hypothetical protein
MALLAFGDYAPDRSKFDTAVSARIENVLPIEGGFGPFPSFEPFTEALPERPQGSYLAYISNGEYQLYAGTATKLFKLNATTLDWDNVSKIGADQVVNGAFAADTDWTKGVGVTIAGGLAVFTAVADDATLAQSQVLTAGVTYRVSFTVSGFSAGGVRPQLTGGTTVNGTTVTANGTYTQDLVAVTGNNAIKFEAVGTTTLNIDNVSMKPLTNYSTPATEKWDMKQFGDRLIATNGIDAPQWIDVSSGTSFADLGGSPPDARFITTVGDFVMLAHLGSNQRGVQWSGLNNSDFWTPRQRSSDFQTFPDGGEIMGIAGGNSGVVIFHAESIRVGNLALETPLVFTFEQTLSNHGCMAPRSIVTTAVGVFYLSDDGFYRYSVPPVGVGRERIDNTFLDDIDRQEIYNVYGSEDPNRKVVYWAYRSKANTQANTYDKVLVYHYGVDRWSLLLPGTLLSGLIDATTPGFTLDSLADLGIALEDLPYPLDSRAWSGGTPTLAAFDSDYRMGFFAGAPLEAALQTGEVQLSKGRRTFVRGFRPLCDADEVTGRVAVKDRAGGTTTWQTGSEMSRAGLIPTRASGKFHKFEVTIPSDAANTWTAVHGVEPDAVPEGEQ